jgi:hypothetical protein
LAIFIPPWKQASLILVAIHHACKNSHILAVIPFNILPIEDLGTPKLQQIFCVICETALSGITNAQGMLKIERKMHILAWKERKGHCLRRCS